MIDFNTPEKHQKSWCFLMFSGVIKVEHCLKMGQPISPRGFHLQKNFSKYAGLPQMLL